MTYTPNAHPRILGALMAATVLPFTPAMAQDATTAPPPVVATVPQANVPVQPAPVQAAPVPSAPVMTTPPVATQPEVAAPVAAAPDSAPVASTPRRVTSTRTTPQRTERTVRPPNPVASAPARIVPPVTPPVAVVAPPPAPVVAPDVVAPVAAEPTSEPVVRSETTVQTNAPGTWLWIALAIGALALIAGIASMMRRRNRVQYRAYEPENEPAEIVPVPVERSSVPSPAPEPVAQREQDRPWIGLALLPVSASASGDTISYELHVDNAGDVAAHDVRVTSFLLNGKSSVAEAGMIESVDARSVDVAVGDQVPISNSISIPEGVSPKILAEARYPLPNGGEGHIAARFTLSTHADGRVEASLDDVLERV